EHIERAVRQVDQIHNAEDQRQPGCQQEQQHAKLHAVETLFDEIKHPRPVRPDRQHALRGKTPIDEASVTPKKQDGRSARASAVDQASTDAKTSSASCTSGSACPDRSPRWWP